MKIEQIAFKRGYVATEEGVLLNPKGLEIGFVKNSGYNSTMIRVKGKQVNFMVHRLQAYQKYGCKLYEDDIVVRHKNNIKGDNSWGNILIGNQSQNMMDIPKQIRIKKAQHAASFNTKYNKEDIKNFHNIDKSYKKTMNRFNISSKGTLNYILNN